MLDYETADFYTDVALADDPHAYFDHLRAQGPVTKMPGRNVYAVTGFDETVAMALDTEHFSTVNSVIGGKLVLPFEVMGDDISVELEVAAADPFRRSDHLARRQAAHRSALDPRAAVHARSDEGARTQAARHGGWPDR